MAVISARARSATVEGRLVADALQMGLSVTGLEETMENMRNFGAMAVYASVMTTKRTAQIIYTESQKHVPYDKGDLFKSAGDGPFKLDGPEGDPDIFQRFTAVERNLEGTWAFGLDVLAGTPMVAPNWAVKSAYGTKMVTKWAVGYDRDGTADHAVLVHENPLDRKFVGGADSPGEGKGPYNKELKWDHFLAKAFDDAAPHFERSMVNALTQMIAHTDRRARAQFQEIEMKAKAASVAAPRALGGPRLVKKVT